jgi:uncharacterized protein YunC (DUF1805 family)
MKTRDISLGSKRAVGFEIKLPSAPLILARGKKGFVMCGYLNVPAAEKLNVAAAVVRGVASLDELLDKNVVALTSAAKKLGVRTGMSGRTALAKLV